MSELSGKQLGVVVALSLIIALCVGGITLLLPRDDDDRAESNPKKPAQAVVAPSPKTIYVQPRQGQLYSSNPSIQPKDSDRTDDSNEAEPSLPGDAIPGEYVFQFFSRYDQERFLSVARKAGVNVIDSFSLGHAVRIKVADDAQLKSMLKDGPTPIAWMPNILVKEPEQGRKPDMVLPEGYLGFGAEALAWLGVAENGDWGNGVTLAILDSGVADTIELNGVNIARVDLLGGSVEGSGHGTAVASLIAGQPGSDVLGIVPDVSLLSVKVLSDAGVGDSYTLAKGIVEAVDRGARIINLCLGSRSDSSILRRAVQYAIERDVLLVASAGNNGAEGVDYPAAYDGVMAVAAVDADYRHLAFSNRGSEIDIAAPGIGVAAAQPNGKTISFSGTSAATPYVAGAAAALAGWDPSLKPEEIVELLKQYSNDAGAPGKDALVGSGVLNVGRLTDRETVGIYDMAVMLPYVEGAPAESTVQIFLAAQNRGTETIAAVDLLVEYDGELRTYNFYNVGIGNTISKSLVVPRESAQDEGVQLKIAVMLHNVEDASPNNNFMQCRIAAPAH